MPGSGKTSLGKDIADRLGASFIELDHEITKEHGLPISDIFVQKGEDYFRKLESELLLDLTQNNESFVMACGGGTPCYKNNLRFINRSGVSVYLNVSYQELAQRLTKSKISSRPLLRDLDLSNLPRALEKKFGPRTAFYERAKIELKSDSITASEVVDRIARI